MNDNTAKAGKQKNMKTNYMVELKRSAQQRAPWKSPETGTAFRPKATPETQVDNSLKNMVGRMVKGVQNFLIKNTLE